MAVSKKLIFKDLGTYQHAGNYLRERFGILSRVEGANLIVDLPDVGASKPQEILKISRQIKFAVISLEKTAREMASQVPGEFSKFAPVPPTSLDHYPTFGMLADIDRATSLVAICREDKVEEVVKTVLLPLLKDGLSASFVTAVTMNAQYQQAWIAFSKISLLAQKMSMGDLQQALQTSRPMDGALPQSLDVPSYVDALCRFAPFAFTIPIRRHGCSWHFQNSVGMFAFPRIANSGIFEIIGSGINPMSGSPHMFGLHGLQDMSEENIWRYLKFLVTGMNRLMNFCNNPENFCNSDGEVDVLRKAQSYTAIHFLFADIARLTSSTDPHERITFAMAALDKISNMCVALGGLDESEAKLMPKLASFSEGDCIKKLLGASLRSLGYDELALAFDRTVDHCFGELHRHLEGFDGGKTSSENERLDIIRIQRNLRHGAFLNRGQYESLFFKSSGNLAETFATLPFLLTLSLIASPREFLAFKPTIAPN